jgi:hypothetical protein
MLADQGGAVAAAEHVRLANELVDAAGPKWEKAEGVGGPGMRIVILDIGKWPSS